MSLQDSRLGALLPGTGQALQALPMPTLVLAPEPSPALDASVSKKMEEMLATTDLRDIRFKDVQEQKAVPFPAVTPEQASEGGPTRAPAANSPGPSARLNPASICTASVSLEVGQRVEARFGGLRGKKWFPGVVQCINEDGTLAIDYDDGDQEKRVLQKHARPTQSKAPKETGVRNGTASKETGAPNGSAAPAAGHQGQPAHGKAGTSSVKPTPAKTAKGGQASATATSGALPHSGRRGSRGTGAAAKHQAAAIAPMGDGQAHERLEQLLRDQGEDGAPPSRSTMKSISIELRSLRPEEVGRLPTAQLQALLEAVQPLLKQTREAKAPPTKSRGAGASSSKRRRRSKGDDASDEEGAGDEEGLSEGEPKYSSTDDGRALEGALLTLNVLTLPQIPRELFVDESLEGVLQLCKYHVAMSAGDLSSGDRKAPPKKPRSPAVSAPTTVSLLAQVLERMPGLVAAHCLNDAQLLQLSALCLMAAFGHGPMALQLAGMEGVLAVYTEYEALRQAVLGELLEKRLSLPAAPSLEERRSYALPDGSRIQMFTALMLFFVQSSSALPPLAETDLPLPATSGKSRSSSTPDSEQTPEASTPEASKAAHPWSAGVTMAMHTMLKRILSQCVEQPQDAEHKTLAVELVRDVLLLFGRPEWPAASLCIKYIGGMLCTLVSRKEQTREQSAARVFSLDLLGSVLATVAEQRRKHVEAPLVFAPPSDVVNATAQPTDAGEVADCVCGDGYTGDFMLDCDTCHRWFHGKCVGVAEAEEDLPPEWHCDPCRLSTAVAEQRQRITRLLSLPEGGDGNDGGEVTTEIEVTKQLTLNYLQTTVADPAAASAQQMLLCEWHAEAQVKKLVPLAKLYREQFALVEAARRQQQALGLSGEERRVPLLTRDNILSASRRLLDNNGLFGRLEPMLRHVLSTLEGSQASTRSKAVKALSAAVSSDPATLQMSAVTNGVHRALSDPAISVREATLDLLGQFIVQRPEFIERYFDTIARRLADTGVSVRKRVIKILRDLCLRNPGSPRAIDACCHLLYQRSDDEEVQKLTIKTFQDIWFAPLVDGRSEMVADEIAERCKQLVAVTTRVGQPDAPRHRAEWLVELLSLLLADDRSDGRSSKEHTDILRVGSQLVSQLIDMLLHVGRLEGDNSQPDPTKLGSVLHALSILCAARPTMLLPHVELLPVYLRPEYQKCASAIRHVSEMLPRLLPLLDHPPRALLEKLEVNLAALIFCVPEPSMHGVICALCAVCQVSQNSQLLGDTLARMCHWLRKPQATAAAGAAHTKRALLCSGLLCRHFDFDARGNETSALTADGVHVLTGGSVTDEVFSILLPFAGQTGGQAVSDLSFMQYSMKGLGHVCVRRPEFAVRCKDVLGRALRADSPPVLKQQALANLLMLLQVGPEKSKALAEQRAALKAAEQTSGSARKMPTDGSVASEMKLTAALTAVLQQHQSDVLNSLLDGRLQAVRREGLHVVGAMLTQGLAHPAKCIPYVMALELDVGPGGCSELAKKELRRQYDRYQSMVAAPSAFLEGARAGYQLQRSLAAASERRRSEPQAEGAARTEAWPAFLYTLLNRKERLGYLKSLLTMLDPGQTEAQEGAPAFLERAEWTAQLLARLPYEMDQELLGLVHNINRMLSLHVDSLKEGLKKDLGDSDDAPLSPQELQRALASDQAKLVPKCDSAALLCLILLLKGHLKRVYQLSDLRCQAFDPSDTEKGRPVSRVDSTVMDSAALSTLPPEACSGKLPKGKKAKVAEGRASDAAPTAEQTARLGVAHYLWLKQLVAGDEEEFDFNIITTSASGEASGGKRSGSGSQGAKKRARTPAGGGRGSGPGSGRGGRGGRGSAKQSKSRKKRKGKHDSSDEEESDAADDEYMEDE